MIIQPKESGEGIKVDPSSPVYGWKDLVGQIIPRSGGAPAPAFVAYRGTNLLSYAFQAGDKIDQMVFHMPHDYVPGSDMFIHLHWGQHGTAISGNFVVTWNASYCKGYNQAAQTFNSELTITQTIPTPNVTTYPRWGHFIEEFQLTNAGGDATHLDRGLLEIDGLILVALTTTTIPTITGGTTNLPFIFTADLHYQSTQLATKGRNYPFYT